MVDWFTTSSQEQVTLIDYFFLRTGLGMMNFSSETGVMLSYLESRNYQENHPYIEVIRRWLIVTLYHAHRDICRTIKTLK